MSAPRTAVVTGASSGIGAATARVLSAAGFEVVLAARRLDRLEILAEEIGGRAVHLDVADPESVDRLAGSLNQLDLLVNNAGGALGLDAIAAADDERWRTMWEVNVMGLVRVTRAMLPALEASGHGHIVNVSSISAFEPYRGGGGYTSVKHGVRAITRTLRLELLGRPVKITELCPGLVETEFSLVRFEGDVERAATVYQGMTPLTGADVAECIRWVASLPPHVNIDELVVRPLDQATATEIHRR